MPRLLLLLLLALPSLCERRPLVVVSVDGLDHRYLRDADRLGLRIPTLRRLLREGAWADGVVGVVPTVTWPSHTTMLTGVPPSVHGILGNRRPKVEGGDYYWSASLTRVPTLWHAARDAGLTTAAITWPVSVDAPLTFNLPELFRRRNGGAMDLDAIASKATPNLVESITAMYPSFPQQWMDDRTRTLATLYLLRRERPGLLTLHLVDLDSEQHDTGPFSPASKAMLERTDELLADILAAVPAGAVLAIVSDHGFARVERVVHPRVAVGPGVEVTAGLAVARSAALAEQLSRMDGIGRRVPDAELRRFLPSLTGVAAAFEPAEAVMFGTSEAGPAVDKPHEVGVHGLWPGRPDYRSVFLLWGKGVTPARLPELSLLDLAGRFAEVLEVKLAR